MTRKRANPAPASSNSDQIGVILVGSVAGLAVCAILFGIVLNVGILRSSTPPLQVTS